MGFWNQWLIKRSKYKDLLPYIVAQAKLETGNFTNTVYNKYNNMFSMKGANKRRQLGRPGTIYESDGGNPFQIFSSDSQSLRDLFLYFDYVNFPKRVKSVGEYVRALKDRSYFTIAEDKYKAGMTSWLNA